MALYRNRILASGELLQSFKLDRYRVVVSGLVLSNQLAVCPFTTLAYRPVYSCQRFSQIRGFVTGRSETKASSEFEQQGKEELNCKMLPVKPFERLPKTVVPVHYDITIKPDLVKLVFEGHESVTLKVVEPVDQIILNSLELELENIRIVDEAGQETNISKVVLDVENEKAIFKLDSVLQPGQYHLKLGFKGAIIDKLKGFYCSKYLSADGEERYSGVTQFEPTDARRAFPCWDEPAVKATFDITLVVPKDRVALCNMPVVSELPYEADPNLHVVKFDRTPIMSTYLVAYVVGEFDYVEERSADGVLVRCYTPVGKKEQGRFGLYVAAKVLPYYKEYFGVEYPLPKMDLVAVADFAAGAMENWGLVTYRETCLLVDDQNTSTQRRQWVAIVVGHELAHQWFGNLVTMEWWTHLWLNEGYATFVESLCVDHLFPEFKIWTQFVTDTSTPALDLDSLKNSHPIEVPIGHPEEIDEIFDDISYHKGAAIIRMLHNYIGDDDFRRGMKLYLTRHKYGNTFTEDLWAALSEASKKPVGSIMSGWTKQMGFPVIRVSARQEADKRILQLSQQRFLADGTKDENNTMWMVPIEIATSRSPTTPSKSFVLEGETAEVVLDDIRTDEWFKMNPGQVGFYRTCYEPELLKHLVSAIDHQTLPPLDRLGLLDDLFALVQAGHSSTVEALTLLEAFANEDQYTVWNRVCSALSKLSHLLAYTEHHELLKSFGRQLLGGMTRKLGWESKPDEEHLTKLLRSLLLGRMAMFDDPEVIAEAERRFQLHIKGEEQIPADFRSTVYKAVLRTGSRSKYEDLLRIYREASLHEEKDRVASALGTIKNEEILKEVLAFAMSNEVRSQDTVFVISSVASSKLGRDLAWNYFKDNWDLFNERFKGAFLLVRLVKSLTENFASEEKAIEIENFFKEHHCVGTERTVQQSVESVRLNAAWLGRDAEAVGIYLTSKTNAAAVE